MKQQLLSFPFICEVSDLETLFSGFKAQTQEVGVSFPDDDYL